MTNPLLCERCGGDLESDDAISIIEGVCGGCRRKAAQTPTTRAVPRPIPRRPSGQPATPRPIAARRPKAEQITVRSTVIAPASAPEFATPVRLRRRRRDLAIGAGIGLVLTLCTTAYLLSTKNESPNISIAGSKKIGEYPVRITVKPANAIVTLDGKEVGPADAKGQVALSLWGRSEDVHWLEISANGYHSVRRPLSIYSGVGEFAVELVQKPFDVAIRTTPDKAEIWINDQLKGYSPLSFTLLPWEKTRLAVRRSGYQEFSRDLAPPTTGDRLDVDVPLIPAGVVVQVETDPPGANVIIEGVARGVAPVRTELESSFLGKQIKIAARMEGYAEASLETTLPGTPEPGPIMARLALTPRDATNPAPATHVQPAVASRPVAANTSSKKISPPRGGQRVVFLLLSPTGVGADHATLLEQVVDQIHGLQNTEQFAVITCTADGLESWPGGLEAAKATNDQKIRAYDQVRSVRPSDRGEVEQALRTALDFNPSSIRLYASGKLDQDTLSAFASQINGKPIALHITQTETGPDDDWLRSLVSAQKGTLTVLGVAATPAVARQGDGVD